MLYLVICLLIGIYWFTTRNHDYWRKRNVKHIYPIPLFGNHLRNLMETKSITEISTELYEKYPEEKVVGYYRGMTPELVIKDLDIVKDILTKDFVYFFRRGLDRNADREPLFKNLFHADGDTWKLLRKHLTPAFTVSKIKRMFPLIIQCTEKLQVLGEEIVLRGGVCDIRDLMGRFTIEFIGTCGFGIEINSINDKNSLFNEFGNRIFNLPPSSKIVRYLWDLFPEIRNILKILDPMFEKIVTDIVKSVREQRNYKPSTRNDFIDLLLKLEANGKIKTESIDKKESDGTPVTVEMEVDLQCMVAQVFVFFAAGFSTSSLATSYTLHQLAFNPDIQLKIQEEIDEVLSRYNNKLCYDAVAEMNLLDKAFKEAMRMFPSIGVIHRVCSKKYVIPKLGIAIDPGVRIIIPVQAIQLDPQYFENPNEFRPERFMSYEPTESQKFAFLPFGEGPRICIGSRLGQMQSLAGLTAVLQKFTVEPCSESTHQFEVDHAKNIVQGPLNGFPLILKLRKPN